jgi:hypothetical protein
MFFAHMPTAYFIYRIVHKLHEYDKADAITVES